MPSVPLRRALREFLVGWRDDLSPAWRDVLAGVEPAYAAVRDDLRLRPGELIFPGRRGHAIEGTPRGSHLFRALDRIRPSQVRVVVVGQDPYPVRAQATGRAFEQGDLEEWPRDRRKITYSLARIIQCAAAARAGEPAYAAGDAGWSRVYQDRAALGLAAPRRIFDRWQRQGVLFLNTGLTLSQFAPGGAPEQLRGHLPLWRPVIERIFHHLAARRRGRVVFAVWGNPARAAFRRARVREAATAAGTWGARVDVDEHHHPNARLIEGVPGFFVPPNPLLAINQRLRALGAEPIDW